MKGKVTRKAVAAENNIDIENNISKEGQNENVPVQEQTIISKFSFSVTRGVSIEGSERFVIKAMYVALMFLFLVFIMISDLGKGLKEKTKILINAVLIERSP